MPFVHPRWLPLATADEAHHAGVRSLPTGHASLVCCSLPPCRRLCCERAYVPVPMASEDVWPRLWLNRFRIWTLFCQSPRTALQYLLLCYYLLFKVLQSDLPNRLHVHLCVLVWITQREGIPAACPSSMASSAEPTEADVAARSWAFDGAKSAAHAIVLNCLTLPRPRQSPLHAH